MPWIARPKRSSPNALVGDAVQMALPMSMRAMATWMVLWRPKMSAMLPQKGMKAAEVRLKDETIQFCCSSSPVAKQVSTYNMYGVV